jgi:hypothetical protein
MERECPECGTVLTEMDLKEGPEYPEYGWTYLPCSNCDTILPAPLDASAEKADNRYSFLPSDPDWKNNPREYHDQIDFEAAFRHFLKTNTEEAVSREILIQQANARFKLTDDEVDTIIESLLMNGDIYEAGDHKYTLI